MKWKTLKIVVILLLAAADVFFIMKIAELTRDRTAETNGKTDTAIIEIMANDGIELPLSLIRHGTERTTVYISGGVSDYTADIRLKLTGTDDFIYERHDGGRRTIQVSDGTRFFIGDNGDFEMLCLEYDASVADLLNADTSDADGETKAEITAYLSGIFAANLGDMMTAEITSVGVTDDGYAVCVINEKIKHGDKTTDITGNIVCLVKDGRLIYASGKWLFSTVTETKPAQTCDFLNILLTVKKAVGENGIENDVKIISVSDTYCIKVDSDTGASYIMPSYSFGFDNGMTIVVNGLDATICK